MDYSIDPSFQGINIIFVLSLENNANMARCVGHFLHSVEILGYNIMMTGGSIFNGTVKNNITTY